MDIYDEKAEKIALGYAATEDVPAQASEIAAFGRLSAANAFEEAAKITDPANNPRRWRADIAQDFLDRAAALRKEVR